MHTPFDNKTYSSLELLFALADPRDLGVSVDDRWDAVVVNVWVATKHALDSNDALVLSLVREHGAVDDVANSIDAGRECKKQNNKYAIFSFVNTANAKCLS